jgi:hypothetical protein
MNTRVSDNFSFQTTCRGAKAAEMHDIIHFPSRLCAHTSVWTGN